MSAELLDLADQLEVPGTAETDLRAFEDEILLIAFNDAMINPPDFTRSLDAARTLIPKGWDGHGIIAWPGFVKGKRLAGARVTLHHVVSSGGGPLAEGFGDTPAIALCVAALRARAQEIGAP